MGRMEVMSAVCLFRSTGRKKTEPLPAVLRWVATALVLRQTLDLRAVYLRWKRHKHKCLSQM